MTYSYGKNILPATVGFDRLFSTIDELDRMLGGKTPTYPPYDIIKIDDYNYQINIAVAGFSKDDINIETENNKLLISGSLEKTENQVNYLHHGLASRDFNLIYTLSDTAVVTSADIVNGILKISIENVIPEERKPRKIPIGNKESLLLEDK